MDTENLEHSLRNSNEVYPLKATRYIYGVSYLPCRNCPFKNEYPPPSILIRNRKCFERCPFKIVLWVLNKEQLELYEKVRPSEKKKEDIELAIREGKVVLVEKTLQRV